MTGQNAGPRILIVDDIEANLFALEDALEPLHVPIDRARSGREALQAIRSRDYSVVLLDVQMPEMDGFETAHAVAGLDIVRKPPIVFVTAIGKDERHIQQGYRAGCVDYLLKPLNLDLVRNKVRFCMDLHSRVLENDRLIRDLKQSNEELQQFAYVASHDLQEPIRMVRNYVQLLSKKYADRIDGKAAKYIGYAVEGSQRMQTLVDDLLELSRVDSQTRPQIRLAPDEVLDGVLRDLRLLLEESGARIERSALPPVRADRVQLAQVFQNLISNAVKFRSERPLRIEIFARKTSDMVEISIRDNGIGVNPKYFAQIFVIFQRLHTRDKYEGSGIGLALCKKIVESHGGQLGIESSEGAGSTLTFSLRAGDGP